MAGHRRKTGRPKQKTLRIARRRDRMITDLHAARTTSDRLTIAINYARSCLSETSDPRLAEELIDHLIEVGDKIYLEQTEQERK